VKKQGVFHGAVVLAVAGFIVKVLGALFKIPLGAMLGPEGNGIFSIAHNIYALIFVIATAGIPVAMSKIVAEVEAKGENSKIVFKKALILFAVMGLTLAAVLFLGAKPFASLMGAESAERAIQTFAPAIFFVSIAALIRGYFQGFSNMIPTAVSEIIEAASKLVFGIGALYFLIKKGSGVQTLAAGAIVGVTAGTAISTLYLLAKSRRNLSKNTLQPEKGVVARLVKTALPITMGAAVVSLSNVIDSGIVMNILKRVGVSPDRALWFFGSYNYATTVFNLPGFLITTLGISLIPTVSGACVLGKYKEMSSLCENAMKLMLSLACAAAGGLFALSEPILILLYGGVDSDAIELSANLLKILALAVPTLALSSLSAALLQGLGDVRKPMYSMCVGAACKVFFNFLLVSIPNVGIYGAAASTVICYGITCVMNLCFLSKKRRIALCFSRILFFPTLAGIFPTLSAKFIFSHLLPQMGSLGAIIVTVVCSLLLWGVCIMLFGVVRKVDINRLFNRKGITFFSKNH